MDRTLHLTTSMFTTIQCCALQNSSVHWNTVQCTLITEVKSWPISFACHCPSLWLHYSMSGCCLWKGKLAKFHVNILSSVLMKPCNPPILVYRQLWTGTPAEETHKILSQLLNHTLSIWLQMEFTSNVFLKTSVCTD